MTTPEPIEPTSPASQPETPPARPTPAPDEARRRVLLVVMVILLMLCCVAGYFIVRYITQPQPLPQMVPLANPNNSAPPRYKLEFGAPNAVTTGSNSGGGTTIKLTAPVGVAVSADGQRIYATESDGDRMIKMFDRDGKQLRAFAPPLSTSGSRQLGFLAVGKDGRVYVVDMKANAIHIFSQDGDYIDSIISHDDTASKLLVQKLNGPIPDGTVFSIDGPGQRIVYILPGKTEQYIPFPDFPKPWGPLGVRFDAQGDLIYTDIPENHVTVNIIPAAALSGDLTKYAPDIKEFGKGGTDPGQFNFPQTVVTDSKGNFYVADGNNYRVQKWSPALQYISYFAFGSGDGGVNLPRGMWMDSKDRLYVADAVGAYIRVYDVSGTEPSFLFNIGELGPNEGQLAYPNDICIDGSGRLYVADRTNNRISVWTY